jgi:predicted phage baseplate assembly protein
LTKEGWREISAKDDSFGFHRRGYLQLSVSYKPVLSKLFGEELHWLRASPGSGAPLWAPKLNGIYINAGVAEQAKSVKQELLGSSLGEPNIQVTLSQTPVLSNSLELRIREDLSEEERQALEADNQEKDKKVEETFDNIAGKWVLWKQVDSFIDATGDSRVYKLDPATGVIRFGDGLKGKIPPAGSDVIRAVFYQNGGGEQGNVDAYTITALKSSVESVDEVTNPIAAAGGVDAPSVDTLIETAPDRLRHRQQALTPRDIEALAVGFSADIIRARCLSPKIAGDAIDVVIAHRGEKRCYVPTLVERDALAEYLRKQAWGALNDKGITVSAPDYVTATVTVQLIPTSPAYNASVTKAAKDKLLVLLHPTDGGPSGSGWPFGREVYEADILRCLSGIPELDRITKVGLSLSKPMSESSLVCSQQSDINVSIELVGEEG